MRRAVDHNERESLPIAVLASLCHSSTSIFRLGEMCQEFGTDDLHLTVACSERTYFVTYSLLGGLLL